MKIFNKIQKQEIFDEFRNRHGVIHKLLSDKGSLIGFYARSEFEENSPNQVNVGITIAFNLYYHFNIEKCKENGQDEFFHSKFFTPADIKYFTLVNNIKKSKEKQLKNVDDPSYILTYSPGDDLDIFRCGIRSVVNSLVNFVDDDAKFMCTHLLYADKFGDKLVNSYLDNNCEKLCEYLYNKIEKIKDYYKNKKICLFIN